MSLIIRRTSFDGKHNLMKVRCFAALHLLDTQGSRGVTCRELALITDASLDYLYHRLPVWCRWGRLEREFSLPGAVYYYELTPYGEKYLFKTVPPGKLAEAVRFVTKGTGSINF